MTKAHLYVFNFSARLKVMNGTEEIIKIPFELSYLKNFKMYLFVTDLRSIHQLQYELSFSNYISTFHQLITYIFQKCILS